MQLQKTRSRRKSIFELIDWSKGVVENAAAHARSRINTFESALAD